MKNGITRARRFVGLDVHAETIAVAVAEGDGGEVRSLGIIANREQSVKKLLGKLGPKETWTACYEAGPTGYALYWQLVRLGCTCEVVAPTLIPVKAGDRVKTDRRDAERLARALRAGDLTAVWVPQESHEALRDLVRAREAAKADQLRARHRVSKYLLRHGRRPTVKMKPWTQRYLDWIRREVKFDQYAQQVTLEEYLEEVNHQAQRIARIEKAIDEAIEKAPEAMREVVCALQALRGIGKLSAVTIVSEVGRLSRFPTARQAMAYSGLVASEHSSGERTRRGGITKTGNGHLRRVLVEAAWSARFQPTLTRTLRLRQEGLDGEVLEIARTARHRLHARYLRLLGRGKTKQQVVTAVARELVGFAWAIGRTVEARHAASVA
jgi:transposase